MKRTLSAIGVATVMAGMVATSALSGQQAPPAPPAPMGFFVTSVGLGDGGNLGGVAGADAHCQALATAAGAGARTWRAYLSVAASGTQAAVNARDRIGSGPWSNAKGVVMARNVDELHGDTERDRNNFRKPNVLTEKGTTVNGVGDTPNQHDVLTGSNSHGRVAPGTAAEATCNNWTSNSAGRTFVGHTDRLGGPNSSWNSVHASSGCSQQQLVATGGAGLFYCFAAN